MTIVITPADLQYIIETLQDDTYNNRRPERSVQLADDLEEQVKINRGNPRKPQRIKIYENPPVTAP